MRNRILAFVTAIMTAVLIPAYSFAADGSGLSSAADKTHNEMIAAGYENGETAERIAEELNKNSADNNDSSFAPRAASSYTPPAKTVSYSMTGDQAADIVGVAATQVGYESSGGNSVYGQWLGINGYAWCAAFASWCANRAGIPSSIVPYQTTAARDWYKSNGLYKKSKFRGGNYIPKAGDMIFFTWNGNDYAQHIGIVSGSDSTYVYTIEGNTGYPGAVKKKYYKLNSCYVLGYACPKYVVQTPLKTTITLTSAFPSGGIVNGTDFRLTGTAKSNYNVARVTAKLYKGTSTTALRSFDSGSLKVSSYALSNLNTKMDIKSLSAGSYKLKIGVTNCSSSTMTARTAVKSYSFSVVTGASLPAVKNTVKLTSAFPSDGIVKGTVFKLTGAASSNYKVSSVAAKLYGGTSTTAMASFASGTVNAASYNLANINKSIDISMLPAGSYRLVISIKNCSTQNVSSKTTSATYRFKVVDKAINAAKLPDLKAPASISVKLYSYNGIRVGWNKVDGATGYYVYYKKYGWSSYEYLGRTTQLYYKKSGLVSGAKYSFRVYPYQISNGKRYKDASCRTSTYLYTLKKLNKPSVSRVSDSAVKVSWNNIYGESGYQIARSRYSGRDYSIVKTVSCKYSSAQLKTVKNRTYYYKVRAYKTVDGKKIYGPWSEIKAYTLK